MKKIIGKIIFAIISISIIITYTKAIFFVSSFDLTLIQLISVRTLLFGFLLYNSIYIYRAYDNIFVFIPSYWSKTREEIQKQPNGVYTSLEKYKLIFYFVLYIIMLIILGITIFITKFTIDDIFTSLAILFFIGDYVISFYKHIN